uniref:N-acylethanolamine-hydrolyzing acid amidase-like n=1 Tax=Saccoglossus kowalevskii TaxID=10224 RepID=A0ABM0MM95_SACKO|nr:PREDICTED: N-acylethanolamine-hydrolyzing acid amidase-like [Saccoglossus kowalevskii]
MSLIMFWTRAFCVLLVIITVCHSDSPVPAPRYILNLDVAPEKRWNDIVSHWNLTKIHEELAYVMKEEIPEMLVPVVELLASDIDKYIPEPYSSEMVGVAKAMGIKLGDIVTLNLLYDITASCTSIVAEDSNGQIWHGRNLDYTFTSILRNLTLTYDAQINGTTVFTASTFLGFVGVLTGIKPKVFTLSIDERDQGELWENLIELVNALLMGEASLVTLLSRDAMMKANTFESAVKLMSETQIVAPAYYIIGGVQPGEGAVITRDRLTAKDVWRLDSKNKRWFLVETNYDHWLPPPSSDDRR